MGKTRLARVSVLVCARLNLLLYLAKGGRILAGLSILSQSQDVHWFDSSSVGEGVQGCYEATLKEPLCARDFFSFADRGNKNCGCKITAEHLSFVQEDDSYDCYHIRSPYELIGNGIVGESIYWFECGLVPPSAHGCYQKVMAEEHCQKDYTPLPTLFEVE